MKRQSRTYSKRWTPEEERVLDHDTRDWYKYGWESEDNDVWVRSSDGSVIEILENKVYRPQRGKFEVRVSGPDDLDHRGKPFTRPWKDHYYRTPEEALESLQDIVAGGSNISDIRRGYGLDQEQDPKTVSAWSSDERFELEFRQRSHLGRPTRQWSAQHGEEVYVVHYDSDGFVRLAVNDRNTKSRYETLPTAMSVAADMAQASRHENPPPRYPRRARAVEDGAPAPRFSIGDRVTDGSRIGEVAFFGSYDPLVGWRYKVLEPDGTRLHWNESSMTKVKHLSDADREIHRAQQARRFPSKGPRSNPQGQPIMKKKYIGVIGDMNPIEHWGGVVYKDEYGYRLLYFMSYEGEGEDEDMVSVYNVDIPDDVFEELDWVDWDQVASYGGGTIDGLREFGHSADPVARASVVEEAARYSGWHELDQDPQEMTIRKAEAKYGRAVDAAHRADRKEASKRQKPRPSKANPADLTGLTPWEEKAHRVISSLSYQAWDEANPYVPGRGRPKKQRPYVVPELAQQLVDALGLHDRRQAEEEVKALLLEHNYRDYLSKEQGSAPKSKRKKKARASNPSSSQSIKKIKNRLLR